MARITEYERVDRLDEAEELLASGVSIKRAPAVLGRRWGLSSRQAYNYVKEVLDRWMAESEVERPQKRAVMEAQLLALYRAAMAKKAGYVTKHGEVIERPDPDIRGAEATLRTLAQMNGLLEPPTYKAEFHLHGLKLMQQYYGLDALPDVSGDSARRLIDAEASTTRALITSGGAEDEDGR